jgi:hypothetical protein
MFRPFPTCAAMLTAATFVLLVSTAAGSGAPEQVRVNQDAAIAVEFSKRVEGYLAIHRKAAEGLPKLSKEATPTEIDEHQKSLARGIQMLRPRAKAGEIFTKDIRAYIRRQLAGVFGGPEGRKLRSSIMDENPGPIRVSANGRYPDTVPLATMPPQVLSALPSLPDELEFRFIADRLILLDVPAHLVVDYIDDALPR